MEGKSKTHQNCLYCGSSHAALPEIHNRKYCSKSCANKAKLRMKKPDVRAKLWQHKPEVFADSMGMYFRGLGGTEIARHFGIPVGTVYSWIHDFGKQQERATPEALPMLIRPIIKSPKTRFKEAESADKWLEVLRESKSEGEDSFKDLPIRLVCGVLHGQSAGKLAGVISEGLKEDPLCGMSYAFCSKGRNTITVIAWKSPVFELSKYVKIHGTFTWPGENLGRTIEVTQSEFESLLFVKKYNKTAVKNSGKTAKNLDIMRFS